jgi:N-acetylmuramoyl-L-alanine amidase
MKYKQVYDLPEFASLADNRQLLVIKSADTFVAVHADAYGDDDYELGIRNSAHVAASGP